MQIILVPIFVGLGIFFAFKIIAWLERKDYYRREKAETQQEEVRNIQNAQQREANWKAQNDLIERYASSSLLPQALSTICNGNYRQFRPLQIIIYNDRLESISSGHSQCYDFIAHRVQPLPSVSKSYITGAGSVNRAIQDESDFVRPQVAMAEAINRFMENEYDIHDEAQRDVDDKEYKDGITYFHSYTSNRVVMTQKPNKSF